MQPLNHRPILQLVGAACLALAWLIPNHYPPWTSVYSDSCCGVALGFLLAGTGRLPRQRLPGSALVVMAVAALPWLQWSFGLFPYVSDALLASLYVGGLAVAIGTASAAEEPATLSAPLAWACLAGSLVSSFMALAQSAQVSGLGIWVLDGVDGMRPYANLGQPNNLATLIGIGFASLYLLHARGSIGRAPAWAIAVVMSLAVAATQSRTALLYGPAAWAALWLFKRRGLVLRVSLRAVAAITAAQWALMAIWPSLQTALSMAASTSLAQREARTIRFLVWPVLLDAMSTRPWLGFGWQQVGGAELSAVDRHPPATELYLQAHNLVLDLAIACGYPLAVILTALMLAWFVTRMRRVRSAEGIAGMLAIAMFSIHAMLELPHHYAYFLIPVGLWVGVVERDVEARTWASARWLWPAAALGAAAMALIWVDYPRMEEEFRLVRFEGARIRVPPATEPVPSNPAFSSLVAFLEQARRTPSKGMTDGELHAMKLGVERYPYAASLKRYAIALYLNGHAAEAAHAFAQIRQLYGPKSYQLYRRELREDAAAANDADLVAFERSLAP